MVGWDPTIGRGKFCFGGRKIGQHSVHLHIEECGTVMWMWRTHSYVIGIVYSGHCTATSTHSRRVHSLHEGGNTAFAILLWDFLLLLLLILKFTKLKQQVRNCDIVDNVTTILLMMCK